MSLSPYSGYGAWHERGRHDRTNLERLNYVAYVGRPSSGWPHSEATLFKVDADGAHVAKVRLRFGRHSLNTLQVLESLQVGDRVILTDMRTYEQYDDTQRRRPAAAQLDRKPTAISQGTTLNASAAGSTSRTEHVGAGQQPLER